MFLRICSGSQLSARASRKRLPNRFDELHYVSKFTTGAENFVAVHLPKPAPMMRKGMQKKRATTRNRA
jgi:hypothetical protein